jgi:hypothetical protein
MPSDIIVQVVFMILGAIVGQALAMSTPVLLDRMRLRRSPELLGRWISVYRLDFRDETHWAREQIEVTFRRGRVVMQNLNAPRDDFYSVDAELVDKTYLIGTWQSQKPGANATGAIMMTISPLGHSIYGYFTGLGDTGERTYCSWVMVREEAQVGRAIELARKLTLGFGKRSLGEVAILSASDSEKEKR